MEMSSSINEGVHEDQYNDWLIEIKEDLEPDLSKCCIYRVPESIRKVKGEAYTPKIVSIGLFHHGAQEKLKDMEEEKLKYVESFFERTTIRKRKEVLTFIRKHEQQIKSCYSGPCKLERQKYLDMIFHDAIFIIELLVRNYEKCKRDIFLRITAEKDALILDFLLLENQLPYFLLEGLYNLVVSSPSFIAVCCKFFNFWYEGSVLDQKEYKHFTDMLRASLVEKLPAEEFDPEAEGVYIPCVTKLQESGVKFKLSPKEHLVVIKFEEGELRIPELNVYHETETKFRNMMALEQCCYPRETLVCDYDLLLDSLIEDKRDAQLLVDKKIIRNWMGDSETIAILFNKLSVEIPLVGNHYNKIYQELNAYHKDEYNKAKAKLMRVYFSDIWRGTATVAASVLLILTFIQTMYSVRN